MFKAHLLASLFVLCFSNIALSQNTVSRSGTDNITWFVSLGVGSQISGIKSEDFVSSNVSPLYSLAVGKWFTPALALQVGYKGRYFYLISDDIRHPYTYLFGEVVFNLNKLLVPDQTHSSWAVHIHGGSGYFYNHNYGRPNVCANVGLSGNLQISPRMAAFLNLSAVIGWDIYQGNEDILPGLSAGVSYAF